MKLVTASIKPHKLDDVRDAVRGVGVHGMTISETRSFGRQGAVHGTYRGADHEIDFVPKLNIEILCTRDSLDEIVRAIVSAARTMSLGDGKLRIVDVDEVVRIRTGARGEEAI